MALVKMSGGTGPVTCKSPALSHIATKVTLKAPAKSSKSSEKFLKKC
jgi:hypothetical protein